MTVIARWDCNNAVLFCDHCEGESGSGIADLGDTACSICGRAGAGHVYVPLATYQGAVARAEAAGQLTEAEDALRAIAPGGHETGVIEHCWVCTARRGVEPVVMWDRASAEWYRERGWTVEEYVPRGPLAGAVEAREEFVPAERFQRAVEVIERYARHDDQCRSQRVLGQGPCNCGYEVARAAIFGGQ